MKTRQLSKLITFTSFFQEAEEEALRRQAKPNWAATASAGLNSQKTLAEIQAEESKLDRQRQEKERQERAARQKEMGLAQASVWGSASANLSWAGKASSNGAAGSGRNGGGFWDDAPSSGGGRVQTVVAGPSPAQLQQQQQQQRQKQQQQQQQQSGKGKGKSKGLKAEEEKVSSIFREKKQPENEFERWCHGALQNLNAQVDIPTFMAFLQDIDSPYEVSDILQSELAFQNDPMECSPI